ncbi:DUF7344 domain-containing protein [Halobellus rufus]|uniref:DUF7344 domain-containing protein n=1 Tax=Halobellus rufus TaxID=1448860 RepID=UPI00067951E6|nr:hypothetical protein [Halobellus rufus]
MVYSRNGADSSAERREDSEQLADDQLYQALASRTRRRLLFFLLDEKESTVETVATVLAGWNADETGSMSTAADRDKILLELSHNHLPRLEEAGLLSYDRQGGDLRIERLDPLLAALVSKSVDSERMPES